MTAEEGMGAVLLYIVGAAASVAATASFDSASSAAGPIFSIADAITDSTKPRVSTANSFVLSQWM